MDVRAGNSHTKNRLNDWKLDLRGSLDLLDANLSCEPFPIPIEACCCMGALEIIQLTFPAGEIHPRG